MGDGGGPGGGKFVTGGGLNTSAPGRILSYQNARLK